MSVVVAGFQIGAGITLFIAALFFVLWVIGKVF